MRFKTIKIKNFKSYGDQEVKLDLNFNGVKLITGKNGVGKTTWVDALFWGIYGKCSTNVDQIVNRVTKKNCKVEVEFTVGSDSYSIVRYRLHEENGNDLLFFRNRKDISKKKASDTQADIQEVIQIAFATAASSVLLSSELYKSFLRSGLAERLKTIESVFSLKDINTYYDKVNKSRKPLIERIEKIKSDIAKLEVARDTLKKTSSDYKENAKSVLGKLKEEKINLEASIEAATKKLEEYQHINVELELLNNSEYDTATQKNEKTRKLIEEERSKIKDIEEILREYTECSDELSTINKIDVEEELRKIKAYEDFIKEQESNNQLLESKNKVLLSVKTELDSIEAKLKDKQSSKEEIEKEISKLNNDKEKCPVCHSDISSDLHNTLLVERINSSELLENEIIELTKSRNKKSEEYENAFKECMHLQHKFDLLVGIKNSNYSFKYLNDLNKEKVDLEKKISLLKNDIANAEAFNKDIHFRIKSYESQIITDLIEPIHSSDFLNNIKDKISNLNNNIQTYKQNIITINEKAKSTYDKEYIEGVDKKIEKVETELLKQDKKLKEEEAEDRYYDILMSLFSNKEAGFKKFFISKMIKTFNERVNFYIPFFFDSSISVTFDKDLNEIIKKNGEEIPFDSLSSGQKTRLEISIIFALFMLVKTFFSSTVNLLVFDEILDKNLDDDGFNSVVEILENLSKQNAVFVISHQEYYKNKFNHHIHIKMNEDEISYIAASM